MMSVEAVIFDFGGVILNLDYPATDKALRTLLGEEGEIRYTKAYQSHVFDDFETGLIGEEEFYRSLREGSGRDLSIDAINKAWNAMLLDVPAERFDFIRQVAKKYRVFLFSNTNSIHKTAFDKTLEKHLGPGGFDKLFEKAYYSHSFGMRKPHVETYKALLKDAGLKAETTLFIDDNSDNIEGARKAGLQVLHLTGDLLAEPRLQELLP
jgi:HAD superfamily hydrolase (TIGR01509 family)